MSALSRMRARRGQRGVTTVPTVLESAMVMGWFVVLLLGEKGVSNAADARRAAETAAEESATKSAANQCQPQSANGGASGHASTSPQVISNGVPNVQSAVALVQALGLGQQRTFPNYVKPLQNVLVNGTSSAEEVAGDVNPAGKTFEGSRDLGCLEKPIDTPMGSMNQYRQKLWEQNLRGY